MAQYAGASTGSPFPTVAAVGIANAPARTVGPDRADHRGRGSVPVPDLPLAQADHWLFIAGFIALALSSPVNYLNRYMKRGFAIGPYLALVGVVALLTALLVPPIVNEATDLADNALATSRTCATTCRRTTA